MSSEKEKELKYEILDENYPKCDMKFKIIVIGNQGVGKSCLAFRATRKQFINNKPSLGFDYFAFNMKYEKKIIKLNIWDTCGQDIYTSLISNYYIRSSLAIIVYAINE